MRSALSVRRGRRRRQADLDGHRHAPSAITQRITNGVIGDRLAVDGGHLVLPVCITVDIINGLCRSVQRARGVGIFAVLGHVAAAIMRVHRGLVRVLPDL